MSKGPVGGQNNLSLLNHIRTKRCKLFTGQALGTMPQGSVDNPGKTTRQPNGANHLSFSVAQLAKVTRPGGG
jgi:hypothetical protein